MDEVLASVELLRVQPGDVIVARVETPLNREQAQEIKSKLREYFRDNEVLITPTTIRISLVRPETST
jgi:hypothetical protein